jgi:hypothetical protein
MTGLLGALGRASLVTTIAGLSAAILAQADDPARRLTHRIWAASAPPHWRENVRIVPSRNAQARDPVSRAHRTCRSVRGRPTATPSSVPASF